MTGEIRRVAYGSRTIDFTVVRRDRKTLEIAVEPDTSVTVAAPVDAAPEAIDQKLLKRAGWILRQQRYFSQFLPITPARRYVSGETHLYLGRQYRIDIVHHIQAAVKLTRGFIVIQTHAPDDSTVTQSMLEHWYRGRAALKFQERLVAAAERFPDPDFHRPLGIVIRQMEQRWGSMSSTNRLTLNPRLIQAPIDAIDYVITHELCHIAEPHHGPAFFTLLDRVMPDWQRRKLRLEQKMA